MFTDFAGPSWLVGYGVIGSTTDSGSVGLGSSPGTPANITIPFSRTRKAGQSGVGSRQSPGLSRSLSQSSNYVNLTALNLIDPRRVPDSSSLVLNNHLADDFHRWSHVQSVSASAAGFKPGGQQPATPAQPARSALPRPNHGAEHPVTLVVRPTTVDLPSLHRFVVNSPRVRCHGPGVEAAEGGSRPAGR